MIDTELEQLYSPSKWAKRDQVIQRHVDFGVEESKKSRDEIPCELNVSYGERQRAKLDIYGTDLPDSAPIFIFVHGGYWQELSKDNSSYAAQSFYKYNIKTIVIGYTLCPEVTLNDIVKEIEQATKHCVEYAKKYGSRGIYMSGYSAGSHLIASLFSNLFPSLSQDDHNLFKGIILCGGLYNLEPLLFTTMNESLRLTYEDTVQLSPIFHKIPALIFPVYVVVGEYDTPAFIQQSTLYFDKIQSSCKAEFKILNDTDHFDIVEKMKYTDYELVKYIINMDKQ
ncbi:Kynurenine formamidase [Carabus blaptoides fortunei]